MILKTITIDEENQKETTDQEVRTTQIHLENQRTLFTARKRSWGKVFTNPPGRNPLGRQPPPQNSDTTGYGQHAAVRILLECILVPK